MVDFRNNSLTHFLFDDDDDDDDDDDYGSYGGNDYGKYMPEKLARAQAFWEFVGHAMPPPIESTNGNTNDNDGDNDYRLYHSIVIGNTDRKVKIIMLDTRSYRDHHCGIPSAAATTNLPLGAGIACLTRWASAGLLAYHNLAINDDNSRDSSNDSTNTHERPKSLYDRICSDTSSDLLGETQWQWLEQQLLASDDVDLIILGSSIQVLTTNPAMESWGHFPREQERLLQLLHTVGRPSIINDNNDDDDDDDNNKGTPVLILSGDVHHGEILAPQTTTVDDTRPSQSSNAEYLPFVEVTSSGLTHDCSKHIYGKMCQPLLDAFGHNRFHAKDNYWIGRNFGSLVIDWEAESFQVHVHDLEHNGEIAIRTGPLSLRPSLNATTGANYVIYPCMNGHLRPILGTVVVAALLVLFFVGFGKQRKQ